MIDKLVKTAAVVCALVIGAVTFCLSYAHLASLARRAGQGDLSDAWPISVDLVLVASTLALVAARRRRHAPGVWVWIGLAAGVSVSLIGNILAAPPDTVSRAVAAWCPLSLALAVELVIAALRIGPAAETHTASPESNAQPPERRPEGGRAGIDTIDKPASRGARVSHPRPSGRARGTRGTRGGQPTVIGPEIVALAARMITEQPDVGRARLARQLGVSEHVARLALTAARSATEPANGNGHLVLAPGGPPTEE